MASLPFKYLEMFELSFVLQKVMSDFCVIKALLNIKGIVPTNRDHSLLLEMGMEKVRTHIKYSLENGSG